MRTPRIRKGIPFIICPKKVLLDPGLSQTARHVYLHILCFSSDRGKIYPSIRTLAKQMNVSPRTVQTGLVALEASGWVERNFRKGRSTIYQPTLDPALCPDVAFKNRNRIENRRQRRRPASFAGLHPTPVPGASGGSETSRVPTGMQRLSSDQELDREKPKMKDWTGDNPPLSDVEGPISDATHSSCVSDQTPFCTWEELSEVARSLLPSLGESDLQETLYTLMSSVMERFPFFEQNPGYQQWLVCAALESLCHDAENLSGEAKPNSNEIENRVIEWVEAYASNE